MTSSFRRAGTPDPTDWRQQPRQSTAVLRQSRRTFVKGLALGGAVAGLGIWRPTAAASIDAERQPPALSGTAFDLTIGETLMKRHRGAAARRLRERLGAGSYAALA